MSRPIRRRELVWLALSLAAFALAMLYAAFGETHV